MSKKKKNTNTNNTVEEQTVTEEEVKAEDTSAEEAAEECVDTEETSEAPETAEEQAEPEEENEGTEEDGTSGKKEKPEKKERKLKWAKEAGEAVSKKAAELQEKLDEANNKYIRLFAEFENFRNRSEKEKSQRYDFGAKDMVERILPVIDNFERGLAAVPEDKTDDSFVTGMQLTYKQLMKVLEDAGVKPIEAVGKEFNPDYHNAVMHVEDPEVGENIIVEEFQKGYTYKDHVVRYSMVKVAN